MPLHPGKSKNIIGKNIKEMEASGHPHDQAVAASLHNADPKGEKMADGGVTAGNPSEIDPGIKDATTSDFLLPYLLGPSMAKAGAEEALPALKGLGEVGEMTLGKAAPAMEEATSDGVTAYVKGIQKGAPGQEGVKIWGVKGSPEKLKALFGDEAPGSVPEHILRAKGVLPAQVEVPGQAAPNAYADGGVVDTVKKDKEEAQKADDIDPVVSSTATPKNYASGGFPGVTFMQDQTPEENARTTHLEKEPAKPKDTDISDKKKLSSIYKAMGIKKYADGGEVIGPPSDQPISFQDKLAQVLHSIGLGHTQQGTDNIASLSAVPGAVGNVLGNVLPTMPSVAEGAANVAAAPGVAPAVNAALGTSLDSLPAPVAAAPVAMPPTPPAIPPVAAPKVAPPPVKNVVPQSSELGNLFNQDTSALTEGVNAEDRNALVNKMGAQQHGLGAIIAQAAAGLGDALATKGGREQHSLQNIFSMQKQQRDEALSNFDKARQDRLQKLALQTQMGNNSIQKLAAQDAYGTDENLNKMLGAPAGTAHKDLPLYFQMKSAAVTQQEKDADLYMKAHAQAATEVDSAVKNASMLNIKPSSAQLEASGAKLADHYYNRAKGNVLVKPSDGGAAQWIPAQNLGKAKQMDPNLVVQP